MGDETPPERPALTKEARLWQDLAEQARDAWQADDFARAGDAFLRLQDRSTAWLLTIARHKGPADHAEEVVAQVYVALLELLEAGKPIRNVKGLMGTILRRRIADAYRQAGGVTVEAGDDAFWAWRADCAPSDERDPFEAVVARETGRLAANTILDALPTVERAVLVARYLDGLSVQRVAERLGLTEDQVKKRSQSAMALARRLAREQELLDDIT